MRLSRLTLRNFRNLGRQDLEFPPEGVAVVGNNAQGKTNLLEAIYYLETFRSFRATTDDHLVAFGEGVFRVVGELDSEDGERVSVTAAFEKRGKRKKVTLDGVEQGRIADALGRLAAVIFSPSDVDLVSGGPSQRRRYLDIVLSLSEPGYLRSLQDFRAILSRRNAALKGGQGQASVQAWDTGLVRSGAAVTQTRRDWVSTRCEAFCGYYSAVSGGFGACMEYRPGVRLDGAAGREDIEAAYGASLAASTERERRLGTTVVGPHRDELWMTLEDEGDHLDLREYGSGGQRRTAALALRLVEARTIRETRGHEPLILLDDVFAELDAPRSERILGLLETEESGQVVITAPKPSDVRIRGGALPRWSIDAGRIAS